MQISAANLIAAQQAAQRVLMEKSAQAAAPAAKAAPAFSAALQDFDAAPSKSAAPARPAPQPMAQAPKAQAGAKLGQHINILV